MSKHKTCNDWCLLASISDDGSHYSALVREIQSGHSNSATLSATLKLPTHHNRVTICVCNEVTCPFVLCLSLCSLQVVCFHFKHYLLQ